MTAALRATLSTIAFAAAISAQADPLDAPRPFATPAASRPAAVEVSWTPMRLPNGDKIALAGFNYFVAVNDDWGFGPSVYGAAQGNYGGIFTTGFTAQRRWRVGQNVHAAASLFAGAGGGLSSDQLRFGGGLMLRPELSLRAEMDGWYAGLGLSHVRFPSGNVRDTRLGLVLGTSSGMASFLPADSGRPGRASARMGVGFDELVLFGATLKPGKSTRNRSGAAATARMGSAGAAARQYIVAGSWWGVEAAGAAQGGSDGYMEILLNAGQDWALGRDSSGGGSLRAGGQIGVGLGGGGNVDTGNGWLWRLGPTLRWQTPWGPSLHLEAGLTGAPSGHFSARYLRLGLGLPLDRQPAAPGRSEDPNGTVREQQLFASVQHLNSVRFKDGSREPITQVALVMTRELSESLYGVAHAGSAAKGKAGAYAFGLFGLGAQTRPTASGLRFGAEGLVGAAGGGGVAVGGGAIAQAEAWAQWRRDRLSLRAGLGQWRALRGNDPQSSTMFNLSIGYAYGTLAR